MLRRKLFKSLIVDVPFLFTVFKTTKYYFIDKSRVLNGCEVCSERRYCVCHFSVI